VVTPITPLPSTAIFMVDPSRWERSAERERRAAISAERYGHDPRAVER